MSTTTITTSTILEKEGLVQYIHWFPIIQLLYDTNMNCESYVIWILIIHISTPLTALSSQKEAHATQPKLHLMYLFKIHNIVSYIPSHNAACWIYAANCKASSRLMSNTFIRTSSTALSGVEAPDVTPIVTGPSGSQFSFSTSSP